MGESERKTMSSGNLGVCEGWLRCVVKGKGREEKGERPTDRGATYGGGEGDSQEGRWFCH